MAYDNTESFYNNLLLENIDNSIPILRNNNTPIRPTPEQVNSKSCSNGISTFHHNYLSEYTKSLNDQIHLLKNEVSFLRTELTEKNSTINVLIRNTAKIEADNIRGENFHYNDRISKNKLTKETPTELNNVKELQKQYDGSKKVTHDESNSNPSERPDGKSENHNNDISQKTENSDRTSSTLKKKIFHSWR